MPERALTIRPVTLESKAVPVHSLVWVWSRAVGQAEIEFRDRRGRVPEEALVPYPVKPPDLEVLRRLDSCFGLEDSAFEREVLDRERYFEIVRCRAHGARFLRDTRGTFAWYTRVTLLRDTDEAAPEDLWSRYHAMPEAALLLEGRTL
jgi:hypothetical protein